MTGPARLATVLALVLAGCATVTNGTNEVIAVSSQPPGASVELRCGSVVQSTTTPAAIRISRRVGDCAVTISKSGFRSQSVVSERGVSPAYWLNFIGVSAILGLSDGSPLNISGDAGLALILTGGLGLVIDAIDGAMHEHEPRVVNVRLVPE